MTKSYQEILAENEELRRSLGESQELLRAISNGEVDALVVSRPEGEQVFTLEGADRAYRVLIEAINDGAVTIASDGTILFCNRHFAQMVKSPLEKVIGSSIYSFIPQADQAAFKVLQKDLGRDELTLRADDESISPVYISINSLKLSESQKAFCVVVTDLTEQKRKEEIVAAEKLARSIIEQAMEGVVVCDMRGKVIRFSNATSRILGCDPSNQNFEDLFDLLLPNGNTLHPVSTALQGDVLLQVVVSFERSKGILFHLLLNAGPLKSAEGIIIGCVVTFTDITERMRTEDALKESEQRYAITLASIGDAVIATDTAGKITFMNAVAEELTGWTLSEAAMKPAKEVFNIINEHTRQRVEDPVAKVLENGVVVGLANHTILVRRDETEVAIDDSGAPIQDHDGNSLGVVLVFRDITERKRADEELHASKERLSAILDQLPVGVGVANDSGQFILSNSIMRCYVSTMIPSRDPEHMKRWCSLDSEGHSIPRDQWPGARALRGETVSPGMEFIYTDDNGRESWVLVSAVPLRGAEEKITGAITVAQDITERRLNEEVLRKSKARFRSVLDNSRDTIYRLNLQTGLYEYISPSAEAVVGFSPDELMAMDTDMSQAMIHPEDLSAMRAVAARLEEAGKGELEYRQRTKKGDYRWISNHMSLIKDKDGQPLYRDGNIRDITELKKVEEELQKTRDYLESLIDYANAPIIVLDPSFRITRFNHASERLTGTRAVEALGESLSMLFPEGSRDQSLDHIRRALTGEHWEAVEIPILKADGSIRIVLWNSANIYAKNGTIIATIAQGQDITDRKFADEELRRARDELESRVQERTTALSKAKEKLECINKELQVEIEKHMQAEEALLLAKDAAEAADRAKSDFMANMSHEIRTPMNAVIGMTSLLLDDEMLNPEQKDFVETIRMSGDALMVIINDILDFSKMQEDKVILEDQPFDLGSCVEEALDLVAQKASEKSLNLAYTIDKSVPDVIIGDPNRLRQILSNLLNNAVKFTEHGEIKLSVSGQMIEDYNEIHFEVQDTGIGISQDQMDRLFQPFNQANNTTTRDYGGTGLGLVISKKLVELMGGKIWAKSELGKGSTFYFTIKAETAPGDEEEHLVGDQPQLVGKHVLIVNDNRTNRRILGAYLYSWGMIPMVAAKTEDALDWVRRGDTFDVAILDADMQDMAGPTLANEMRRYNKTLPLVMLTSIGRHLPTDHAYLTKPIKPSQLHRVLTNIISVQLAQKSERAEAINKEIQMSSLRILLAEDNVSSQKVAKQILKRLGYKADVVANGIEALQALERQPYDLVLMDLKMPEMDGLQATRIIRQHWPDNGPKIIAITAYALQGDKEKCIEAGMDDYISKPIKMNELADVLRKHQTTENM